MNAEQLLKKMAEDVDFRKKVESAPTPDAKRAILGAHGFTGITAEEVKTAAKTAADVELSDRELEAVAGGVDMDKLIMEGAAVLAALAAAAA